MNDTYAPATYSPTHPEAASPYSAPPVSAHEVYGTDHTSVGSNGFDGSPVRETIPEVDEEELQATPYEPAAPPAVTASPQSISAGLRLDDQPAWSAQLGHAPLSSPSERASPAGQGLDDLRAFSATVADQAAPLFATLLGTAIERAINLPAIDAQEDAAASVD